jgi:hypothetical protein
VDISGNSGKRLSLSECGQAAAYLLASTLIWAAPVLARNAHSRPACGDLLQASAAALSRVEADWASPFAVGGVQAVFTSFAPNPDLAAEDGSSKGICEGPRDASAWDALWEACHVAGGMIHAASSDAEYALPAYMSAHWTALLAEGLLPGERAPVAFSEAFGAEFAAAIEASAVAVGATRAAAALGAAAVRGVGLGGKAATCTPVGALTSSLGCAATSSWLRLRMNIFDAEVSPEAAECCRLTLLEKYTAMGYFEDIFTFFDPIINEDGTKLGSMELLTAHLLAVSKQFAPTAHLEYMLVEMLFQVLLQHPITSALNTAVFRLILELCRQRPQLFPAVVALGTNTVFQMIPDLDPGSSLEFGRWFSYHLVNTQLNWPAHYWEFWVSELQEAEGANEQAIPLFTRFVVEKCAKASVPERLRTSLPEALHRFIPPQEAAHCPLFDGTSASVASSMLGHLPLIRNAATELLELLESKADPDDVADWLDGLDDGAHSHTAYYSTKVT